MWVKRLGSRSQTVLFVDERDWEITYLNILYVRISLGSMSQTAFLGGGRHGTILTYLNTLYVGRKVKQYESDCNICEQT
jgi:hypothetical protein